MRISSIALCAEFSPKTTRLSLIRASNRFNRPLLQIRHQTRVPMCFDTRLLYCVSSGRVMHMIAFFASPCVALGGCLFHHNCEPIKL